MKTQKNKHEITALCDSVGISPVSRDKLIALIDVQGSLCEASNVLNEICVGDKAKAALSELESVASLLRGLDFADRLRLDFSVVNNMSYYDGIVFSGFLSGICEAVLSGGQYGRLLSSMGKQGDAVGFAIYLDLLSELDEISGGNNK